MEKLQKVLSKNTIHLELKLMRKFDEEHRQTEISWMIRRKA